MRRVNEVARLLDVDRELYLEEARRLVEYAITAHELLKNLCVVNVWGFPPVRAVFVMADQFYCTDLSQ